MGEMKLLKQALLVWFLVHFDPPAKKHSYGKSMSNRQWSTHLT